MSTSYYRLRKPFTKIKANWTEIDLETDNGTIVIIHADEKDLPELLYGVLFDTDYNGCVLHGYFGGKDKGATLTIKQELDDDYVVLSEYNELMTVKEVKENYQTFEKE